MFYVIMCGGQYDHFGDLPRALHEVQGEPLVARTIRQLKARGVDENLIFITASDPRFKKYGVVLQHENSYRADGEKNYGYWLDAFYPHFPKSIKVTFLFGDVKYTDYALEKITGYARAAEITGSSANVLYGTSAAKNPPHENWGEPFAYVVCDYRAFMEGVKAVKKLQDEGKTKRIALVWELYRYLNGLDVNVQQVLDETYITIDDGTIDADDPERFEEWNRNE